jgi:Nucleoside 2-deoxyribosyltransferase
MIEEMREQFRVTCAVPYSLTHYEEDDMHHSAYLCGPINGCTDEEANGWRSKVKSLWPGKTIDPMRRDYRGREAQMYREIVELDKIDIQAASCLIVSYDKPSVGTSMEVFIAYSLGKPVVIVAAPHTVISPWLHYHSHAIVTSYEAAVSTALSLLP